MKRRLLKLGVFLLFGAIVNVAMAWGGAAVSPNLRFWTSWKLDSFTLSAMEPRKPSANVDHAVASSGGTQIRRSAYDEVAVRNSALRLIQRLPPLSDRDFSQNPLSSIESRFEAGWPMTALASQWRSGDETLALVHESNGVQWNLIGALHTPLRGFAINTIFYAAILALLFYTPGKARRWVRVHRSQCPACGHIIAAGTCANGLCSECGFPLPKGFKPRPDASSQT